MQGTNCRQYLCSCGNAYLHLTIFQQATSSSSSLPPRTVRMLTALSSSTTIRTSTSLLLRLVLTATTLSIKRRLGGTSQYSVVLIIRTAT